VAMEDEEEVPWEDGRELSLGLDDASSAPGIEDGAFRDPVDAPIPDDAGTGGEGQSSETAGTGDGDGPAGGEGQS